MDLERIGKFIAELRKAKGLTQAQLAEHFDISNKPWFFFMTRFVS